MSPIRFTQVSLILAFLLMSHLAVPKAVDSGSSSDRSKHSCYVIILMSGGREMKPSRGSYIYITIAL